MKEAMDNYNLEQTILRNIITNKAFMRKVLPHIKSNYFTGEYKTLFENLRDYVGKYNRLPTLESLKIEIDDSDVINDNYEKIIELLPLVFKTEKIDDEWLVDKTEKWCQDRAIYNAIYQSIGIIDGNDQKLNKNAIPGLLSTALAVTFNPDIGHDYFEDVDKRYDFYHSDEERIEFDLEYFNKITSGGLGNKTFTVFLGGTGTGKSLVMCHMAAANLVSGKDVLYITMEMSEEKIAERIDSNLLNVPVNEVKVLPKTIFADKVKNLRTKTLGSLIIKEYPTGQPNAGHFRALLMDLKIKKDFVPKIIYIDYVNICSSSRMRMMGDSYSYVKAIAEELRGLAIEFNLPIISATQTNRAGFASSDPGLENTSESFGLPATCDVLVALITNEELEKDGQLLIKQLKNRYNDISLHRKFLIGIDRNHMRLYDLKQEAQDEIVNESPVVHISELTKNPDKHKKVKEFIF